MDANLLQWAATLGVGGVLAAFMFTFYRKDMKEVNLAWKGQSEMLLQIVKENTIAVTSSTKMVEAVHNYLIHTVIKLEDKIDNKN